MTDYVMAPDLASFAAKGVERFDGMLNKGAAIVAAAAATIVRTDSSWNERAFLEIGVYKGKFFSLIEHATKGTDARLIGIDPFVMPDQSRETVEEKLRSEGADMDRIILHKGYSFEEDALRRHIADRKLSLCHIDGSHLEKDVYNDICMVERLAADDAIIIGDDFWNRSQLQVTTAFFRIVLEDRIDLKPFMLSSNKIYLCRQAHVESYQKKFRQAFEQNLQFSMFSEWLERAKAKRWYYTTQKMAEWTVILI